MKTRTVHTSRLRDHKGLAKGFRHHCRHCLPNQRVHSVNHVVDMVTEVHPVAEGVISGAAEGGVVVEEGEVAVAEEEETAGTGAVATADKAATGHLRHLRTHTQLRNRRYHPSRLRTRIYRRHHTVQIITPYRHLLLQMLSGRQLRHPT
jgi:hypothetical protein